MSAITAAELLDALTAGGVVMVLDTAGELVIRAPRGSLTPDIRAAIQKFRDGLVATLQERQRSAFDAAAAPRWRAAWEEALKRWAGSPPRPHLALERAIDAADLAAFEREVGVCEAAAVRAVSGEDAA